MPDSTRSLPGLIPLPRRQQPSKSGVKHISLALQGGGSHGAFTWGVMHRLISEPRFYIDGLSGTSAGAMNAVVFADGFIKGSRQGAIDALAEFWEPYRRSPPAAAQLHPRHSRPQRGLAGRCRPDVHASSIS